jgi:hypothetical protein
MADNGYRNQAYSELLLEVSIYMARLLRNGMSTERAATEAANEVVRMNTAFNVQRYPALGQFVEHDAGAELGDLIKSYMEFKGQPMQQTWNNQPNHPQMQPQQHYPIQAASWQQNVYGNQAPMHYQQPPQPSMNPWGQPQQPMYPMGGYPMQQASVAMAGGSSPLVGNSQLNSPTYSPMEQASGRRQAGSLITDLNTKAPAPIEEFSFEPAGSVIRTDMPASVGGQVLPTPSTTGAPVPAASQYSTITFDGVTYSAVRASEYKGTKPTGQSGLVYNEKTHELYYAIDPETNKAYKELLERKGDDMNYDDHELESGPGRWQPMSAPSVPGLLEKPDAFGKVEPNRLSGAVRAASIEESEFLILKDSGIDITQFPSVVYTAHVETPFLVTEDEAVFLDDVDLCSTMGGLIRKIRDHLDPSIIRTALEKRIVEMVNIHLAQVGWEIEFAEDYFDLRGLIASKFSEGAASRFVSLMDDLAKETVSLYDSIDASRYLEKHKVDPEDGIELTEEVSTMGEEHESSEIVTDVTISVLCDTYQVVKLPVSMKDLNQVITGKKGGMVKEISNSDAYSYLETILSDLEAVEAPTGRVLLRTITDERFYVYRGWVTNSGIYIAKV